MRTFFSFHQQKLFRINLSVGNATARKKSVTDKNLASHKPKLTAKMRFPRLGHDAVK